jgi:hypothetical protein
VSNFAGSGGYTIELAQGSAAISDGSQAVAMGSGDVITIRDTYLTAGVPTVLRATPSNTSQDAELFVLGSSSAATAVRSRSNAVAVASATGPGGVEQLTYTAPVSGWYGVVLLNKSGSGVYTVLRDATPPVGSVVINSGAATTKVRNVTVAVPANDPQSAVRAMRVAADGVLDTEPWITYAATKAVTLPGPSGLKRVSVQLRNGAGLVSPVLSDTIVLSLPDLYVPALSNPPAASRVGQTFGVTSSTRNLGPAAAGASRTRFWLSVDGVKGAGDRLLSGSRAVPTLAAGAMSTGRTTLGVVAGTPAGTYHVIACADDLGAVSEGYETNNCRPSATRIVIR